MFSHCHLKFISDDESKHWQHFKLVIFRKKNFFVCIYFLYCQSLMIDRGSRKKFIFLTTQKKKKNFDTRYYTTTSIHHPDFFFRHQPQLVFNHVYSTKFSMNCSQVATIKPPLFVKVQSFFLRSFSFLSLCIEKKDT